MTTGDNGRANVRDSVITGVKRPSPMVWRTAPKYDGTGW